MRNLFGSYRSPRRSSYAKGAWWTGHFAEVLGAITGFAFGFALALITGGLGLGLGMDWLPWLLLVVGAIGARALVRRQYRP
jgi:hypothetical protein